MLTLLVPQYFLFDVILFQKRKTAIDDIAVRPITQFPVSLADEAATLLKRTEGLVTLIVSNPTKKPTTPVLGCDGAALVNDIGPSASTGNALSNSLAAVPNNISTPGTSIKPALRASAPPSRPTTPVPEPPADPLTCPIISGKDTQIEINTDNKTLGIFFIGGKDTVISDGIIVGEVYGGGIADKDGRLQPGDQILEVNGTTLKDATHTAASQALRQTLPKMKITVYRPEKLDFQTIEAELIKKPGKGMGLSVIARKTGKGVYVSEILNGGSADIDGRIMKGDLLVSVNGQNLENASGEEAGTILKTVMGRVALKFNRYKAIAR